MIKVNRIKLPAGHSREELPAAIIRKLHIAPDALLDYRVLRESLDARRSGSGGHPGQIFYMYSVAAEIKNEDLFLKKHVKDNDVTLYEPAVYVPPVRAAAAPKVPPVIIGSGPAGLFCGLILARQGYHPVITERGSSISTRTEKVRHFWETGELDPECNVSFGEGGAGTFSDGKLNTLVKDPYGRHRKVLEMFVECGAPEEILYVSKPHLGTDRLAGIVENMRNEIVRLGGTVLFDSRVTDFITDDKGTLAGLEINGHDLLKTNCAVLATGHSARDTFSVLKRRGVKMEQKAFAVGVRIEHPQSMINSAQYQDLDYSGYGLPPADYKLTYKTKKGRSVYTFCMCPGGYVVNASSEPYMTAVNGMSFSARDGDNANSAVIVGITPDDLEGSDPLAGIEFQRRYEHLAWLEGRGRIPVQRFDDFCLRKVSKEFGYVYPADKGGFTFADLWKCLPDYVCESIEEGICSFGTRIKGFDRGDAVLSGVETRTSSPVRIIRDENMQSSMRGLYPCGEGAGYSGGITSSAMDGLRVAEAVAEALCEKS